MLTDKLKNVGKDIGLLLVGTPDELERRAFGDDSSNTRLSFLSAGIMALETYYAVPIIPLIAYGYYGSSPTYDASSSFQTLPELFFTVSMFTDLYIRLMNTTVDTFFPSLGETRSGFIGIARSMYTDYRKYLSTSKHKIEETSASLLEQKVDPKKTPANAVEQSPNSGSPSTNLLLVISTTLALTFGLSYAMKSCSVQAAPAEVYDAQENPRH